MDDKVIYAFGMASYQRFYDNLVDFIYTEGEGIPFPAVLGCLELAKRNLIEDQEA